MKCLLNTVPVISLIALTIGIFGCEKESIESISSPGEVSDIYNTINPEVINSSAMKSSCSRAVTAQAGISSSYVVDSFGCLTLWSINNQPDGNCAITLYSSAYSGQMGYVWRKITYNGQAQPWQMLFSGTYKNLAFGYSAMGQCPTQIQTMWMPNDIPYFSVEKPKSQERDAQQNGEVEETRQEESEM